MEKISKEQAIECLKDNAQGPLSPAIVQALKKQMDINADGQIDYHEFARACEKILSQ